MLSRFKVPHQVLLCSLLQINIMESNGHGKGDRVGKFSDVASPLVVASFSGYHKFVKRN